MEQTEVEENEADKKQVEDQNYMTTSRASSTLRLYVSNTFRMTMYLDENGTM